MKNILVVIDSLNFTESQLEPVKYISRLARGRITIALLEMPPSPLPVLIPAIGDAMFYSDATTEGNIRQRHEQIRANTEKLRAACLQSGMDITLHTYEKSCLEAVIRESRFADVLLVQHNLSLAALRDSDPTAFIRELLLKAECPVLTLPGNMQVIKEVVLAYNGTYSSVYAIRTFFHLFPLLALRKVKVIYVREKEMQYIPDDLMLRHYLNGICRNVDYLVLSGSPAGNLKIYLQYRKHTLVTLGAYGRSRTSRFFNGSAADDVLGLNHVYTFITHP